VTISGNTLLAAQMRSTRPRYEETSSCNHARYPSQQHRNIGFLSCSRRQQPTSALPSAYGHTANSSNADIYTVLQPLLKTAEDATL